jgi:shikimate dehydrogenase
MDDNPSAVDRYGVMGYPVSHSRSPVIHRLFALQTGQNIQYELLQVAPSKLETAIKQFQRTGGKGLNITVPHKSEATRLVDHLSERASTAGAVNTLVFKDNDIIGDNTDGIGLMRDLLINLKVNLTGSRILILGAGGAARGIIFGNGQCQRSPFQGSPPEFVIRTRDQCHFGWRQGRATAVS